MSEFVNVELDIKDGDCLIAAIKDMGYVDVEQHDEAQNLNGYQGDRRQQKANIIVRKESLKKVSNSASNDIGFKLKSDGNYELIISEYDQSHHVHGVNFTKKLNQYYAKQKSIHQAKRMGYSLSSQKIDEKGRMRIRIRAN